MKLAKLSNEAIIPVLEAMKMQNDRMATADEWPSNCVKPKSSP